VKQVTGTDTTSYRALRVVLVPLALAQFICSFAGSNMNVMINDISHDLHTTVQGVQISITAFLLVMAALMIPGSKLTDRFGRKRWLVLGLVVYGVGAVLSAAAPGLGVLILGNSVLEGVGTAMLIPPVYILVTLLYTDVTSRARAFGVIMAMAGIGAATGPLIGGLITTAISWRASFGFQALVIVAIVLLSRSIKDPLPPDRNQPFDVVGAALSAIGLMLVVMGIVVVKNNGWLALGLIAVGAVVVALFFWWLRVRERAGREPLISTALFHNRVSNLGLVTQNIQWLVLLGSSFVIATYLQVVRHYNAIETGVFLTTATLGMLLSSLSAERLAKRRQQRTLVTAGFVLTIGGVGVLLALSYVSTNPAVSAPGLFLMGLGIGLMLTPSVNIVQSSFPEDEQGEISGLSRSVSNLGSSMGTAIAGTILVSELTEHAYAAAMITLAGLGFIGLVAALALPRGRIGVASGSPPAARDPVGN
jgi:MFS family permease